MKDYWSWRGPQWMARIRVELHGVTPAITRVIQVDSTLVAFDLHLTLQKAFGWTESHLHEFRPGFDVFDDESDPWQGESREVSLVVTDTEAEEFDMPWWVEALDELDVTVGQLFALGRGRATYVYDFGDNWRHTMTLVDAIEPTKWTPRASILESAGPSPLEDSGGELGLMELLATLRNPEHTDFRAAWEQVRFIKGPDTTGYDARKRQVSFEAMEWDEHNAQLLRRFGTMVPHFGD